MFNSLTAQQRSYTEQGLAWYGGIAIDMEARSKNEITLLGYTRRYLLVGCLH